MDKPHTTIQRDDYQLTIYRGIVPLDPNTIMLTFKSPFLTVRVSLRSFLLSKILTP